MRHAEPEEVARFDAQADHWWNPDGPFRGLHDINPLRLQWIEHCHGSLVGQKVADIGCGGGLLAESMAARGATVTAIDLSERTLTIARQHAMIHGLAIDYRLCSAETLAQTSAGLFDLVTCLELLEHVPHPESVIIACAQLLKPGGSACFSSINRTRKAGFLVINIAEQVLGLIPEKTHHFEKFIRPSTLAAWARQAGLTSLEIRGMNYSPFSRQCRLSNDSSINYLLHACKGGPVPQKRL